jgi:hypothetical protein
VDSDGVGFMPDFIVRYTRMSTSAHWSSSSLTSLKLILSSLGVQSRDTDSGLKTAVIGEKDSLKLCLNKPSVRPSSSVDFLLYERGNDKWFLAAHPIVVMRHN